MKKMGKLLALLLCVVMCVGCLTGCMGAIADIQVNEDGSVDVVARMGMTEEGIKMAQESDLGSDMGDTTFEYNGVTYYGGIINALMTNTSGTKTLTLGTDNLDKLSDAEKAIATERGWTLA